MTSNASASIIIKPIMLLTGYDMGLRYLLNSE